MTRNTVTFTTAVGLNMTQALHEFRLSIRRERMQFDEIYTQTVVIDAFALRNRQSRPSVQRSPGTCAMESTERVWTTMIAD